MARATCNTKQRHTHTHTRTHTLICAYTHGHKHTLRAVRHFRRRNVCYAFEFVIDTEWRTGRGQSQSQIGMPAPVIAVIMAALAHDRKTKQTQQRWAFKFLWQTGCRHLEMPCFRASHPVCEIDKQNEQQQAAAWREQTHTHTYTLQLLRLHTW